MTSASNTRLLASTYLDAKRSVVDAGFSQEIEWQASLNLEQLTEPVFLREAAWVVLNAGMREAVVRRRFDALSEAFLLWSSAREIVGARRLCQRRALAIFNHRPKITAIVSIAYKIAAVSFEWMRSRVLEQGAYYLQRLPFIGPVTSLHLAKNIGLHIAKPDRHLTRIATLFGFPSAQAICEAIAREVCDSVPVVDIVLWRYATLHSDYLDRLRHTRLKRAYSTGGGSSL
jgi:hypothetical protein